MRQARRSLPPDPKSQTWATFLVNHADEIWACDFVQPYDLSYCFRPSRPRRFTLIRGLKLGNRGTLLIDNRNISGGSHGRRVDRGSCPAAGVDEQASPIDPRRIGPVGCKNQSQGKMMPSPDCVFRLYRPPYLNVVPFVRASPDHPAARKHQ